MNEDDENVDFEALVNDDTPLVIPKRRGVEDYRLVISAAWQKAVPSIFETGGHCLEASFCLGKYELRELKKLLPFSDATFSKLKAIAADKRLHEIADRLPPNWTIIADLQRLPDGTLKKAIDAQLITPALQRQNLQAWLAVNATASTRAKKVRLESLPQSFDIGIRVPHGYPEARLLELHTALSDICQRFEVQIVRQRDQELERVLRFAKAIAARMIRAERFARRAKASKHQKAGSWPFDWNETSIKEARSLDDIAYMFQQLNMGVEFQHILARARGRLAHINAIAAARAAPGPTLTQEEIDSDIRAFLAKRRKPSFLHRRKKISDFAFDDDLPIVRQGAARAAPALSNEVAPEVEASPNDPDANLSGSPSSNMAGGAPDNEAWDVASVDGDDFNEPAAPVPEASNTGQAEE